MMAKRSTFDRAVDDLLGRGDAKKRRANASDSEDTSRSDGSSLAMGTTEYREMIYDHRDLNEFEQRAAERERAGVYVADDFADESDKDKAHATYEKDLENDTDARRALNTSSAVWTPQQRKAAHEVRKEAEGQDTLRRAQGLAERTASDEDDKAVRHVLPKELEDLVYDDSKTDEDVEYLPRSLRRYM